MLIFNYRLTSDEEHWIRLLNKIYSRTRALPLVELATTSLMTRTFSSRRILGLYWYFITYMYLKQFKVATKSTYPSSFKSSPIIKIRWQAFIIATSGRTTKPAAKAFISATSCWRGSFQWRRWIFEGLHFPEI
jgi:hypothetical protein